MISLNQKDIYLTDYRNQWANWFGYNPPSLIDLSEEKPYSAMYFIISILISLITLSIFIKINKCIKTNYNIILFENILLIITLICTITYLTVTHENYVCSYKYKCSVVNNTLIPSYAFYQLNMECPENNGDLIQYYIKIKGDTHSSIRSKYGPCYISDRCELSYEHHSKSPIEIYQTYIDNNSGYSSYSEQKEDSSGSNCYDINTGILNIIQYIHEHQYMSNKILFIYINVAFYTIIFITLCAKHSIGGDEEYHKTDTGDSNV